MNIDIIEGKTIKEVKKEEHTLYIYFTDNTIIEISSAYGITITGKVFNEVIFN
jgi:hypothetical protein